MPIVLSTCLVRPWSVADIDAVARHANSRRIWLNLRDRFPHPYTVAHARLFIEHARSLDPGLSWAIEVDGEAVGGIGIEPMRDVERVSAEVGYWLGDAYWNRGIMTEVLRAVTADAFGRFDLTRVFALPFADNASSIRVLEKAGFALEGRLRQSAVKDGVIRDQLLYAAYRPGVRLA